MQANLGASQFVAFANKCWPAFEKYFGHVPCYLNSRLAAKGIPAACEADIYGALSEYMAVCATEAPPSILDINNSVPKDMYEECRQAIGDYALSDLWMGFHCGNTSIGCLVQPVMQHQLIMHRLMEPNQPPNITRGTLESRIKAGDLMKEVAPLVGGKGGGRPDMAQGGGPDVAGLDKALVHAKDWLQKQL